MYSRLQMSSRLVKNLMPSFNAGIIQSGESNVKVAESNFYNSDFYSCRYYMPSELPNFQVPDCILQANIFSIHSNPEIGNDMELFQEDSFHQEQNDQSDDGNEEEEEKEEEEKEEEEEEKEEEEKEEKEEEEENKEEEEEEENKEEEEEEENKEENESNGVGQEMQYEMIEVNAKHDSNGISLSNNMIDYNNVSMMLFCELEGKLCF